mmetsp:Transcript_61141/g.145680  ORF Transcript_61141/g.145680 Transcript_61141/m.145680 type:complete len:205 (-) Transcript_61141:2213-2827(-)
MRTNGGVRPHEVLLPGGVDGLRGLVLQDELGAQAVHRVGGEVGGRQPLRAALVLLSGLNALVVAALGPNEVQQARMEDQMHHHSTNDAAPQETAFQQAGAQLSTPGLLVGLEDQRPCKDGHWDGEQLLRQIVDLRAGPLVLAHEAQDFGPVVDVEVGVGDDEGAKGHGHVSRGDEGDAGHQDHVEDDVRVPARLHLPQLEGLLC